MLNMNDFNFAVRSNNAGVTSLLAMSNNMEGVRNSQTLLEDRESEIAKQFVESLSVLRQFLLESGSIGEHALPTAGTSVISGCDHHSKTQRTTTTRTTRESSTEHQEGPRVNGPQECISSFPATSTIRFTEGHVAYLSSSDFQIFDRAILIQNQGSCSAEASSSSLPNAGPIDDAAFLNTQVLVTSIIFNQALLYHRSALMTNKVLYFGKARALYDLVIRSLLVDTALWTTINRSPALSRNLAQSTLLILVASLNNVAQLHYEQGRSNEAITCLEIIGSELAHKLFFAEEVSCLPVDTLMEFSRQIAMNFMLVSHPPTLASAA